MKSPDLFAARQFGAPGNNDPCDMSPRIGLVAVDKPDARGGKFNEQDAR
jgi:hypothetical protein